MNPIVRTAVVAAATLAGLAPVAGATAGRAPVTASPQAAGCPAAGWRAAATIPVSGFPYGVAVNTRTDMIYAASSATGPGAGSVSVIDGRTRAVVATVAVGQLPYGVAVNPATDTVYVTNGDGTVSVINGQTNTVTATIQVGGGPYGVRPYGVWADRLTNRIYLAVAGAVVVINGQTNKVIDQITVAVQDAFWLALDPRTNTLYATNQFGLKVDVINLNTDQVTARIQLPRVPYGIAVDPKTDQAYVVVAGKGLFVIDGQTNTVTAKISIPDAFGVAVDAATGQAFVANPNENTVTVVNGRDHAVAGSMPAGRSPFIGLAADPHRGIVYVTNVFGSSVSVLVQCQPSGG
jgi:YVTN family beta-propeller protein